MLIRAAIFLYFAGWVIAGACFARAHTPHLMAYESQWVENFIGDVFFGGGAGLAIGLLVVAIGVAIGWVFTGKVLGDRPPC